MAEIVNRRLIEKYVLKIKKSEASFQKDYTSANFVFLVLFGIGFMCIVIYYKYCMKEKEKRRAKRLEEARRLEEEAMRPPPSVLDSPPKALSPHQIRNVSIAPLK
jgi:hypothetical protein